MKSWVLILLLTLCSGYMLASNTFAADAKLAQTGFQFLSVPVDARSAAMGEAMTTVPGYSLSMFHNPATMALMTSFSDFSFNQSEWIYDIKYTSGSVALNPFNGLYGTLGFSVLSVNYGDFIGTMVDPKSDKGYIDTGIFSPTAFSFGVAYAKSLSDRFAVGGHFKYVNQELGNSTLPVGDVKDGVAESTKDVSNKVGVWAIDFGTVYQTGFKSLAFGMTVRNFSQEAKFQTEGFQLPLTFTIGLSMNVFDFISGMSDMHKMVVSVDALHPRAYAERLNIGGEYVFMDMLALRAGYLYNYDERDFTVGFGVQKFFQTRGFAIDYAYTPFGIFDNVTRMSVRLAF
jgi:hypothetical protein